MLAVEATRAGDKRWKKYASDENAGAFDRGRKVPEEPRLRAPASLLLRLRTAFGVNAKADVLASLLGTSNRAVTTSTATEAIGYSRATVSGALDDLSRAAFIEKSSGRPVEHRAPTRQWKALLWEPEEVRTEARHSPSQMTVALV